MNPLGDLLSYSRLDTFHTCPRSFYYTYVEGNRGGDNIYSFIGTIAHEIVEKLVKGEMDIINAVEHFNSAIDDADMLGFEWLSEKTKSKYIFDITHFIENFDSTAYSNAHIEDHFEVSISGYPFHGYIDCWMEDESFIYIEDFKTSSKYSKKDLISHAKQLAIYAAALKEYADSVGKQIKLRFNMLKYVKVGKKLVERIDLKLGDDFSTGYVEVEYTDELQSNLEAWVSETMGQIESLDPNVYYRWKKNYNPMQDFFCINLCSHRERCMGRRG